MASKPLSEGVVCRKRLALPGSAAAPEHCFPPTQKAGLPNVCFYLRVKRVAVDKGRSKMRALCALYGGPAETRVEVCQENGTYSPINPPKVKKKDAAGLEEKRLSQPDNASK